MSKHRYSHPEDVLVEEIVEDYARIAAWHRRRSRLHIEKNFNERNDGDNQFDSKGTWMVDDKIIPGYTPVPNVQGSIALGLWMKDEGYLGCRTERTLLIVPVWDRVEHPDKPDESKDSWRRVFFDNDVLESHRTMNADKWQVEHFLVMKGLFPITPSKADGIRAELTRFWEEAGDGPPPGAGLAGGPLV